MGEGKRVKIGDTGVTGIAKALPGDFLLEAKRFKNF